MVMAAAIMGTAGVAGSIGSAIIGSSAAQKASQQQVQEQQQALALEQQMFGVAQGALSPYISTGTDVGKTLTSLLTPGPNQTAALSQIPGFQFAQDWGQKATQNLGTTTGLGGNVLTAGAKYATGLAQQNFGNLINPLLSIYGTGEGAGAALAGSANSFGNTMSSIFGNIGTSQAAGTLGSANALMGGLQGGVNSASSAFLLSKLLGGGAGGGSANAVPQAPEGMYG